MPHFEFSWKNEDDSIGTFNTCCPVMAETMMRSQTDFPQVTPAMKRRFHDLYGQTRGGFANVLRKGEKAVSLDGIDIGIEGLTIRARSI